MSAGTSIATGTKTVSGFGVVLEYPRIFINLASVVLALSLTFFTAGDARSGVALALIVSAWACWIGSIIAGAWVIRRIATLELQSLDEDEAEASVHINETVYAPGIRRALTAQPVCFVLGFVFFILSALAPAPFGADARPDTPALPTDPRP
ncbi:MAG: hypothetical protein ACFB6R_13305 [Alphaproteobacteria bacterium]